MSVLSVSQVARQIGVSPRVISDAFYRRWLDDSVAPVMGRQRVIPAWYVATIERVLRERGVIEADEAAAGIGAAEVEAAR